MSFLMTTGCLFLFIHTLSFHENLIIQTSKSFKHVCVMGYFLWGTNLYSFV